MPSASPVVVHLVPDILGMANMGYHLTPDDATMGQVFRVNRIVRIAPGTLDHLEKLYIDQDGVIHRVLKSESKAKEKEQVKKPESKAARASG